MPVYVLHTARHTQRQTQLQLVERERERARGRDRFSRGLLLVLVRKFRTMGRKCVAIKIIQFLALFVFNLLHRQSQLCDELVRTSITR